MEGFAVSAGSIHVCGAKRAWNDFELDNKRQRFVYWGQNDENCPIDHALVHRQAKAPTQTNNHTILQSLDNLPGEGILLPIGALLAVGRLPRRDVQRVAADDALLLRGLGPGALVLVLVLLEPLLEAPVLLRRRRGEHVRARAGRLLDGLGAVRLGHLQRDVVPLRVGDDVAVDQIHVERLGLAVARRLLYHVDVAQLLRRDDEAGHDLAQVLDFGRGRVQLPGAFEGGEHVEEQAPDEEEQVLYTIAVFDPGEWVVSGFGFSLHSQPAHDGANEPLLAPVLQEPADLVVQDQVLKDLHPAVAVVVVGGVHAHDVGVADVEVHPRRVELVHGRPHDGPGVLRVLGRGLAADAVLAVAARDVVVRGQGLQHAVAGGRRRRVLGLLVAALFIVVFEGFKGRLALATVLKRLFAGRQAVLYSFFEVLGARHLRPAVQQLVDGALACGAELGCGGGVLGCRRGFV
ncbi:hypothetical protein PoMZ_00749 [Pyricularia oryzae]|uniref:Uncharacterized protein n=1 Tax=Pyricularia oryzae TaxID=318829 RepID=A0A4V1C5B9_PYROR|nr:hypothetical protein PoMZ_00749 [Pyricularia oryzae]